MRLLYECDYTIIIIINKVVGDTAKLYEDYTIIIIINKVVGDTTKLYECDYTVMNALSY